MEQETDDVKMHCSTCMLCVTGEINPADVRQRQAFCHAHPPMPILVPGIGPGGEEVQAMGAAWPPVNLSDPNSWCGDWDDGQGQDQEDNAEGTIVLDS